MRQHGSLRMSALHRTSNRPCVSPSLFADRVCTASPTARRKKLNALTIVPWVLIGSVWKLSLDRDSSCPALEPLNILELFNTCIYNPPTSRDRRVRVLLHFSYLIAHILTISYSHISHSHNLILSLTLILSYLVSHIWGGEFEGGELLSPTPNWAKFRFKLLCHTYCTYLLYYTSTILIGFIPHVRVHTRMPI